MTGSSPFRDHALRLWDDDGWRDVRAIADAVGLPVIQTRLILERSGRIEPPAPKPPPMPEPKEDEARYLRTMLFVYGDVRAREAFNAPDLAAWNRLGGSPS